MKNNDIKNLSEAYELINEISTDRLRSALRNSKDPGFEYDKNHKCVFCKCYQCHLKEQETAASLDKTSTTKSGNQKKKTSLLH